MTLEETLSAALDDRARTLPQPGDAWVEHEQRVRRRTRRRVATGAGVLAGCGLLVVTTLTTLTAVPSQRGAPTSRLASQPPPTAARSSASPTPGRPVMRLSQASGIAGDRIRITVSDCDPVPGQDSLTWHDSAQYQGSLNHREAVPPFSLVPFRRSGRSLTATFRVLSTYTRGQGVLDKFCNNNANAVADFTVR